MRKNYDVAEAILQINPDAKFTCRDNDTDKIEWAQGQGPMPNENQIDAAAQLIDQNGKKTKVFHNGLMAQLLDIENRLRALEGTQQPAKLNDLRKAMGARM